MILMSVVNSSNNSFSSVAANTAASSCGANNCVIIGAAAAVPFFMLVSTVGVIMQIMINYAIGLRGLIISFLTSDKSKEHYLAA